MCDIATVVLTSRFKLLSFFTLITVIGLTAATQGSTIYRRVIGHRFRPLRLMSASAVMSRRIGLFRPHCLDMVRRAMMHKRMTQQSRDREIN